MVWRRFAAWAEKRSSYDRSAETVTVRSGPLAGMKKYGPYVDSDPAFARGLYEPEIVAALIEHAEPGGVFFDIGANVGYHTLLLARLAGAVGHVDAFEPAPAAAASLEKTLQGNGLSNVTVHRIAVGATEGHAAMQVGAIWESGRSHIVGATAGYRSELAGTTQTIEVPVTSIDILREKGEVAAPTLVKIDVEGSEVLALRGMEETLRSARPVLVAELWGTENIASGEGLLQSLGYGITVLSEWRGRVDGVNVEIRNILAS